MQRLKSRCLSPQFACKATASVADSYSPQTAIKSPRSDARLQLNPPHIAQGGDEDVESLHWLAEEWDWLVAPPDSQVGGQHTPSTLLTELWYSSLGDIAG